VETPVVDLMGLELAAWDQEQLVDHVMSELEAGRGGWIVTANLDFLRKFHRDAAVRRLYGAADLRIADGMPLVWASKLQGEALPSRIAGSTLTGRLAGEAATRGRSIFLMGGQDGAAEQASRVLSAQHPGLRVAGFAEPMIGQPPSVDEREEIEGLLSRAGPDLLFAGFGTPKQEQLLQHLRGRFPRMWMVGVGGTFNFIAGRVRRAPTWIQDNGLEWVHRLAQEPRRLAKRYLLKDLPFSAELFASALVRRRARDSTSTENHR
jgi:N-acetylglucosaminyldiphosphoundecaprenol N-acetyl-beta-D-mannosaminyltransferase